MGEGKALCKARALPGPGFEVQIALEMMRNCDAVQDDTRYSEIMEGPWRQMMHIRDGSMQTLVTAGNDGTSESCCIKGRDNEPIRDVIGIRKTAPLRPQQKMKSGVQATWSMSGASRSKLQIRAGGDFNEKEKILPVCEPTMHMLKSPIHGLMQMLRTRQSIVKLDSQS